MFPEGVTAPVLEDALMQTCRTVPAPAFAFRDKATPVAAQRALESELPA